MKVVRLLALCTACLYPPGNILVDILLEAEVQTTVTVLEEKAFCVAFVSCNVELLKESGC